LRIRWPPIPKDASCTGKPISTLPLPDGSRLISVKRDGLFRIADDDTVLRGGDQVLAVLEPGREDELRSVLFKT
jgi:Trk K+ transport system NAD-binding subunit